MLFNLSDDVRVVEQLREHERSFVADLQSLGLQHYLFLTLRAHHLTSYFSLLNASTSIGLLARQDIIKLLTQSMLYHAFRFIIYWAHSMGP